MDRLGLLDYLPGDFRLIVQYHHASGQKSRRAAPCSKSCGNDVSVDAIATKTSVQPWTPIESPTTLGMV
jgi:hypothetical protein